MSKTKNKRLDDKVIWDLMNEEWCTQGEILSRLRKRQNMKRDYWFTLADKYYPGQMGGSPSNLSEVFNEKRSLPFSHIVPLISVLKLKEFEKNHYISELVKANLPDNLREFVDENAGRSLTKKLKNTISVLTRQVELERSSLLYLQQFSNNTGSLTRLPISTYEYRSSPEIMEAVIEHCSSSLDDYRKKLGQSIIDLANYSDTPVKRFVISCIEKKYLSKFEILFVPGLAGFAEFGYPYDWVGQILIPPAEGHLHAKLLVEYQNLHPNFFSSELNHYIDVKQIQQENERKNANRTSATAYHYTVRPEKPSIEYCFHNFMSDIYKKTFASFPELYRFVIPRAYEKVINFEFLAEGTFELYLNYKNSKRSQSETFWNYINKRSNTLNPDKITPQSLLIDIYYFKYFYLGSLVNDPTFTEIFDTKFSRQCLQDTLSFEEDVALIQGIIEQKRIEFLSLYDQYVTQSC